MSSEPAILAAEGVRFGYHRSRSVLDVERVAAEASCVHALIGPNASGKSTLLKVMLGALRPWRGGVRMGEAPLLALPPRRRAAWISYVPQRASVSFAFRVREVVEMGRFALDASPGAVERAIEMCELADLAELPYTELSVGQQQRVLLARAMAQAEGEGRIMLLDEPVSAMDLEHVHRTMVRLRAMARAGMGIVVVLQDINLAARYADRVWLLSSGRIAASGEWGEVLVPEVLEPVYRVRLSPLAPAGEDGGGRGSRPCYDVWLAGTEG